MIEQKHFETNNFLCLDCKVDTKKINEYYMVLDVVWNKAMGKGEEGMLCIGCLEKRLSKHFGKKTQLGFGSFTHCPLNCSPLIGRSHRLVQRMMDFTNEK